LHLPPTLSTKSKNQLKKNPEFIVAELEFSPNFNPWRLDRELLQLREKIEAKKQLMEIKNKESMNLT
jgi:hypothetical protein